MASSLDEYLRYILTAYVLRRTGDAHDAHVSVLIAEATGNPAYTEAVHREWRERRFAALRTEFGDEVVAGLDALFPFKPKRVM